jgi:glycerol-3-phosphate dehydrogenase
MTAPLPTRTEAFAALERRGFDVLVIGGGIVGCGAARDAALRGLSVALVEKDDFASGTSSRSSRLVHGGLRYLEHGQFHLVFEASGERRRLLRLAPHLVRPLEFTWPVYDGARVPRWKLGAGLWLYDALALFRNVGRHTRLNRDAVVSREPCLSREGLRGGAAYFDAATNDARLTLANAIGAAEAGAVVLNHAEVVALTAEGGRVTGATIRDAIDSRTVNARARAVVNATGPWSDQILRLDHAEQSTVHGSKGVHIAVPRGRVGNREALTLLSPADGRVFFALPAGAHAIIGTTDTFTSSPPDAVRATNEDVRYLLDAASAFFPAANLSPADVVSAWAGIRPLVPAVSSSPGAVSREHAIIVGADGLVSITGGKLTTYRIMAKQVIDVVFSRLGRKAPPCRTSRLPLPGGDFASFDTLVAAVAASTGDALLGASLASAYGTRWPAVWNEMQRGGGNERLDDALPYTVGELRYAATHEMACTVADALVRRTRLAFETRDHGIASARRAARALGLNEARALSEYERDVERLFAIG